MKKNQAKLQRDFLKDPQFISRGLPQVYKILLRMDDFFLNSPNDASIKLLLFR